MPALRGTNLPGAALALLFVLILWQTPALARGGLAPEDPMVRITAPPVEFEVSAVLAKLGKDVSKATGIKESLITYYWQTFDAVVYEGKPTRKPLFVDLYVPSFFSDDDVRQLMNAVADALVAHAGVERKWLFIHTHFPLPEQVYINGGITKYDTYRGKPIDASRVGE